MAALFGSGQIVDLILALMAFELLALLAYRRVTGRGVAPVTLLVNILSGAFILLALRGVLVGAWWGWIGLCLIGALVAHSADLWRRWQ